MKKKEKISILIIFCLLSLIYLIPANFDNKLVKITEGQAYKETENTILEPHTAKYRDNFTFIYIYNGNWSKGITNGWIKGQGTYNNPYRIENMTIDATDSPTGCGIYIQNSHNVSFVIKNCTINNAPAGSDNAGIKIQNAGNATLIGNNVSNNLERGIYALESDNLTIDGNIAYNSKTGFYINDCKNISIINNRCGDQSILGIYVNFCFNGTVSHNNLTGNGVGLDIASSEKVRISFLNVSANDNEGFTVRYTKNCSFWNLTANNNGKEGIRLYSSNNNTFTNITAKDNSKSGMKWHMESNGNHLLESKLVNNSWNGIYLSECNDSVIRANQINGNGLSGLNISNGFFNTVEQCNLSKNQKRDGIYLEESCNNSLISNWINNNSRDGIALGNHTLVSPPGNNHYNVIWGNTIKFNEGKGVSIIRSNFNNISDNSVSNNMEGGIYIRTQSFKNNLSRNCVAWNNDFGISIRINSENNSIIDNEITHNQGDGISIASTSPYNVVRQNTLSDNQEYGLYISGSKHCDILDNTIIHNAYHGVILSSHSDWFNISQNTISSNGWNEIVPWDGLQCRNSENGTIWSNTISFNYNDGIQISSCLNVSILENTIYRNAGKGIYLIKSNNSLISANTITYVGACIVQEECDEDSNTIESDNICTLYSPNVSDDDDDDEEQDEEEDISDDNIGVLVAIIVIIVAAAVIVPIGVLYYKDPDKLKQIINKIKNIRKKRD